MRLRCSFVFAESALGAAPSCSFFSRVYASFGTASLLTQFISKQFREKYKATIGSGACAASVCSPPPLFLSA